MASSSGGFVGSVPDLYEAVMVPMLFQPYAEVLAERVAAERPGRVLEVAAGTGALTRNLANRLPDTELVATDLSQAMLDRAAASAPGRVTWRQADAQHLPFPDASFDVVVNQFGIMFVPDKELAYSESRRVLTDDGCLLLAVWDGLGSNELAGVVAGALADRFPDDPPRFIERVPHGYHDASLIERQLISAGFGAVTADLVRLESRAPSAAQAATGFLLGTPTGQEVLARAPGGLDPVVEAVTNALHDRFGDGPVVATMTALVVTARR